MTIYLLNECHWRELDYNYGKELSEVTDTSLGYFTNEKRAKEKAEELNQPSLVKYTEFLHLENKKYKQQLAAYKSEIKRNDFLIANNFTPMPTFTQKPKEVKAISYEDWLHQVVWYFFTVETVQESR